MKKMLVGVLLSVTAAFAFLVNSREDPPQLQQLDTANLATAIFAGGCFWCVEADFEQVPGVAQAISGYTGGSLENPTYEQVAAGSTGHLESVMVYYDPQVISYTGLLEAFWRIIDPTDAGGQFSDRGKEYSTAIFYASPTQKETAEQSLAVMNMTQRFNGKIVTPIVPATAFYPAETHHQDYYKKHPFRYRFYRHASGRNQYLEKTWGEEIKVDYSQFSKQTHSRYSKPSATEIHRRLTPLQYKVTQKAGTEPAFDNAYWNEKHDGIYVDIVTGEPLFSSRDKFDSGTGWPSFTRPLELGSIVEKTDYKRILPRTEVRSSIGNSHLGHLFDDGPAPTNQRYCINSAALRFIPKQKLEQQGYDRFLILFE